MLEQQNKQYRSNYGVEPIKRQIQFLEEKSKRLKKRIFKCFCGQEYGVGDKQWEGEKNIVCPKCNHSYFLRDGKVIECEENKQ